jgi:hypothetical protein
MARVIESYIAEFHQDFVFNRDLKIKISGCMNFADSMAWHTSAFMVVQSKRRQSGSCSTSYAWRWNNWQW